REKRSRQTKTSLLAIFLLWRFVWYGGQSTREDNPGERRGGDVEEGKVGVSYYCTSCGTRHKTLGRGICPTCGSQAVVTVGWYKRSVDERSEWFQRIRGEHRGSSTERTKTSERLKKANKTKK